MNLTNQIAKQLREVQLNGDWVSTNLKSTLSDVTLLEAKTKIGSLNTIAELSYHIHYYIKGISNVLNGGELDIRDKYSFNLPDFKQESDWQYFLESTFREAELFAVRIERLIDEKLAEGFVEVKYGNYYRNLTAMIEHSYYHLGQIVILKKLIKEGF